MCHVLLVVFAHILTMNQHEDMRHEHALWFSTDCPPFVAYSLRVESGSLRSQFPILIVLRLRWEEIKDGLYPFSNMLLICSHYTRSSVESLKYNGEGKERLPRPTWNICSHSSNQGNSLLCLISLPPSLSPNTSKFLC